jgi:SAM-dependent methyltransferase
LSYLLNYGYASTLVGFFQYLVIASKGAINRNYTRCFVGITSKSLLSKRFIKELRRHRIMDEQYFGIAPDDLAKVRLFQTGKIEQQPNDVNFFKITNEAWMEAQRAVLPISKRFRNQLPEKLQGLSTSGNLYECDDPVLSYLLIKEILQEKGIEGSSRLLDLGCAEGLFTYVMTELGVGEVTGIDRHEFRVAVAKEYGINIIKCDILDVPDPLKEMEFDVVYAKQFFNNFPDVDTARRALAVVRKHTNAVLISVDYHPYNEEYEESVFLHNGFKLSEVYCPLDVIRNPNGHDLTNRVFNAI